MSLTAEALIADNHDEFVVADRAAVRFIVINRPASRNALTRQMRRQFPLLLAAADEDSGVAVIVLTGAGSAFCAGVDLKERLAQGPAPLIQPSPALALRATRKPVIAAINGPCITGGLEMALSCSFAIASAAARFADTHAKVGLPPKWGQPLLLVRAVGVHRARQMMLGSEFLDAQTALAWGIVNELTPADRLLDRCLEIGTTIAAANPDIVQLLQSTFSASDERVEHE